MAGARLDPEQAAAWPDPDDRFPARPARHVPRPARGPPSSGSYLPGDHEYFALRARDRTDLPGTGELRCVLRSSAVWVGDCAGTGRTSRPHGLPGQPPLPQPQQSSTDRLARMQPGLRSLPAACCSQPVLPGQPAARPAGPASTAGLAAVRPPATGRGQWRLSRRAVIEAWGGAASACGLS